MQDAWQVELAEVLHLQPQRAGAEAQLLRDLDELIELGSLERQREAAAHFGQAYFLPIDARDHRQG